MILALKCEAAARLLSDAHERRLTFAERLALKGHLLVCAWCRRYRDQLHHLTRFAAQLMPSLGKSPTLPGSLLSESAKDRIRRRVLEVWNEHDA
jgi:hypothetical protein